MLSAILEYVPVAVLVSVASATWKVSGWVKAVDVKLLEVVKNTEKCDTSLQALGERVAGVEGELRRMNGGE